MLKRWLKIGTASLLCGALFFVYIQNLVPDRMYFAKGEELSIKSLPMVKLEEKNSSEVSLDMANQLVCTAKLWGIIPLKTVNVSAQQRRIVSVAGTPFGIKMFSDGVMVVGFSDITTAKGSFCPAREAQLKMGDVIVALNGTKVQTNRDVEDIILAQGAMPVTVSYIRDGVKKQTQLKAVVDSTEGSYRTGMWVRDSSAGVGTMTFYDVQKGLFAGLGHGIKDTDTQKEIPLLSGEIVNVRITGCVPSKNGTAGELKGVFTTNIATGRVLANNADGVYGRVFAAPAENMMEVASPQQVQTGKATILATVDGTKPQEYSVVIEKVSLNSTNSNKNMVIRITDSRLLDKTGGIVQGMSGSPIIQNGRLVGAVTHVFINNVERGYGIFAQNMVFSMDNAQKVHKSAG